MNSNTTATQNRYENDSLSLKMIGKHFWGGSVHASQLIEVVNSSHNQLITTHHTTKSRPSQSLTL